LNPKKCFEVLPVLEKSAGRRFSSHRHLVTLGHVFTRVEKKTTNMNKWENLVGGT
jgi:hypothetical protein